MNSFQVIPPPFAAESWCRHAFDGTPWITPCESSIVDAWGNVALGESRNAGNAGLSRQIVIHRAGFSAGNAATLRWHHCENLRMPDIGCHLIIGNGRDQWSPDGFIQAGRDLNSPRPGPDGKAIWDLFLIDSPDHFQAQPPTARQSAAAIHALSHLLLRAADDDSQVEILPHESIDGVECPGPAVPVAQWASLASERACAWRQRMDRRLTLDLSELFQNHSLHPDDPESAMASFRATGITRLVFPFTWYGRDENEITHARRWVDAAHASDMSVLLTCAPFGPVPHHWIIENAIPSEWLWHVSEEQSTKQAPRLIDPASPHLPDRLLPRMERVLAETDADGLFFTWPVFPPAHRPAEHDSAETIARFREDWAMGKARLHPLEASIHDAMFTTSEFLRARFPHIWIAANAGAGLALEGRAAGRGVYLLNGWCDEPVAMSAHGPDFRPQDSRLTMRGFQYRVPPAHPAHAFDPSHQPDHHSQERMMHTLGIPPWWTGMPNRFFTSKQPPTGSPISMNATHSRT